VRTGLTQVLPLDTGIQDVILTWSLLESNKPTSAAFYSLIVFIPFPKIEPFLLPQQHSSAKMSGLQVRGNGALTANPDVFTYPTSSDINITTHGSDWYWAVTGVMFVSTLAFVGMSFRVPRRNRVFHYITAAITMTAAVAYFTMASNLGYAAIQVEFARSNPKVSGQLREIFYVRYIDWFVTTPVSHPSRNTLNNHLTDFAASPDGSPPHCWSAMAYSSLDHLP
jgi:hypothetical protein